MTLTLCASCLTLGYCHKKCVPIVRDGHLDNPEFVRDVRASAYRLNVGYRRWHNFITAEYMKFDGWIMGPDGKETYLDTSVLERPSIDYWFRDFCCRPCPPETRPRVRRAARQRVIVLATILKASAPREAQQWGVRPANDNIPAGGAGNA